jgi:hypothetical protein
VCGPETTKKSSNPKAVTVAKSSKKAVKEVYPLNFRDPLCAESRRFKEAEGAHKKSKAKFVATSGSR